MRWWYLLFTTGVIFNPNVLSAGPPAGQSALLNGMHDIQSHPFMAGATSGCDKGWITDLRYLNGSTPVAADCYTAATNDGISIIQRLDYTNTQTFAFNLGEANNFASSFAHYVTQCPNIHVWIVGNEPNFSFGKSDPDCTAEAYAASYAAVQQRVHSVPGHAQDLVLLAANSPFSPGCLQSMRMIIQKVQAKGVTPDGFAIHAYTQIGSGPSINGSHIALEDRQNDSTIDECAGGATWNDNWHRHFKIYKDYIQIIEGFGLNGKPVFITESGNVCDSGGCYPDADQGYFQAMYAEIDAHNKSSSTKIRGITPYRWMDYGDGTSREYAISKRPGLQGDLRNAFAHKYAWTDVVCTEPPPAGCTDDGQCQAKQYCVISSGKCTDTSPCGPSSVCPANFLCRQPQNDCVPIHRGSASLEVKPYSPAPNTQVSLDVSSTDGYTNVNLRIYGPNFDKKPGGYKLEKIGDRFHWIYTTQVGAKGTYRANFTADPSANTVYALTYFNVGIPAPPPPPPGDAGVNGDGYYIPNDGGYIPPVYYDGDIPYTTPTTVVGSGCNCCLASGSSSLRESLWFIGAIFFLLFRYYFRSRRRYS